MGRRRPTRTGLRIRGARGHPEVRAALLRFARWLRLRYEFPMRVPVYLSHRPTIRTRDGREVSASIFLPFDPTQEPFIRIATGDYPGLKKSRGRDNALAGYICSLCHEVIHYRQWLAGREPTEKNVPYRAGKLLDAYALTTDHP